MLELLEMDLEAGAESFFREFHPYLYRFVWSRTGGPHSDVEEIAQDVLLHAWRDREKFRGEAAPLTWILSIARHRLLEHRRKSQRKARADEVLRALQRIEAEAVPDDLLQEGELKARVWAALERIGKPYAEVLVLRYLRGRSVQEIARELGEGQKAVESRLHRAREAFRKELVTGGKDEP